MAPADSELWCSVLPELTGVDVEPRPVPVDDASAGIGSPGDN